MLDETSEDQTDWLSLPAPLKNWTMVETPPGDAVMSPQMPAANAPDAGNDSQPAKEVPESESPLTSLSPSPRPSPPPQYLDPITPPPQGQRLHTKIWLHWHPRQGLILLRASLLTRACLSK